MVNDDLVCGDRRAPGTVHLLEVLVNRVKTKLVSPVVRALNFIRQVRVDDRLCSLSKQSLQVGIDAYILVRDGSWGWKPAILLYNNACDIRRTEFTNMIFVIFVAQ